MEIEIDERAGATIVRIRGRLDSSSSPELERRLEGLSETSHSALVLDFRPTIYVSSAGLKVLLTTAKTLSATGRAFLLCGVNTDIMEVFKVTGFHRVLNIFDDLDQALATLP